MSKDAEIKIYISLNEQNYPDTINWTASDSGIDGIKEANAMLLSFWDKKDMTTLAIDLWTTEMLISDLNIMYFEVLMKMAETYEGASKDTKTAAIIRDFANKFAVDLGLMDNRS